MNAPETPRTFRVLLVDDQQMIGEIVRRMLLDQTHLTYRYCSTGAEAMRYAEQESFDIILQDLVMPVISGVELVRHFRAQERTAKIPIIILSSSDELEVLNEARQAGATDCLLKLPSKQDLLACLRKHLPVG